MPFDIEHRGDMRDLYDFFDKNDINVCITPEYYSDGINWCWQLWWIDLDFVDWAGGTGMYGDNNEYKTRTSAEEAAFTKAFEILNDKLKI